MREEAITYSSRIKELTETYFKPNLTGFIDNHIKFVKNVEEYFIKYYEEFGRLYKGKENDQFNNIILDYHKFGFNLISKRNEAIIRKNFDQEFEDFISKVNEYLDTIDKSIIRVQDKERFSANKNDSLKIQIIKKTKRIFYKFSQIPVITGNLFRKIFKRQAKPAKEWKHRIPLRNLISMYFRDDLCSSFLPVIEEINKSVSAASLKVWEIDEEISRYLLNSEMPANEFQSILKNTLTILEEKRDSLTGDINKAIQNITTEFDNAYSKAGTIELPYRQLSKKKVEKTHHQLNEEFEKLYSGWSNTFFSLFEDWRLNKELYILCQKNINNYLRLRNSSNEKLKNKILVHLNKVKEFLNEVINKFQGFSGRSSEVEALLYREKNRLLNQLSKIIIKASDIVLDQNIPALIDDLEYNVNRGIKDLSDKRAVVKITDYNRRIKDSEINYISPFEVITFSALPSFTKSCTSSKTNIMQKLDEVQHGLKDIDQIADFSLESAISMFSNKENAIGEPLNIAAEGIKRAILKAEKIEKIISDVEQTIAEDLSNSIKQINDELINLTKNENILDIKFQIAKAKTLRRTEELKQKSVDLIKNFLPLIAKNIRQGFSKTKDSFKSLKKRLGLTSEPVHISTEISDFLSETETAISKLPFVYQRLFRIEPLEDKRFFVGRKTELSRLNSAFGNWKNKKYAPVVLVGEKGSGTTTLLNFFFNSLDKAPPVLRTTVKKNIFTEEHFISFLKDLFKNESLLSLSDVIEYLNNKTAKQIIVIENLQNLYLKKVNGFVCIKLLVELISKTNNNVFWIIASSLYTWEYLKKVLKAGDYFGYIIKLKNLENQQIIDIILNRHRISGYNIHFEHNREYLKIKKFRGMSLKERQDYLKAEFFSYLNKFAKSNISLALLYWMRATREVTVDTIKIGSVISLDFSFLKALSTDKVFTLYVLLLHDGLTGEDHASVFNLSDEESRLRLLALIDDGIIIQRDEVFIINPLLYRQVVNLLEIKNIIH
jgi:hypothetical protein